MSLARRSLQVVAFIATLVVGAASMAVIVTQTTWFKEWLRGFIVRQAEDYVNGRLAIGRLDGNLFFGVEFEDVDVTMNGEKVVDIKGVAVDYNALSFITGRVVLDDIRINRPVLRLEQTADGWNLAQLIKARTPDPDEPTSRLDIEIGEIGVSDGTVYVDAVGTSGVDVPSRIEKIDASVGLTSNADELQVTIGHVSLRAPEAGVGVNDLSGIVRRTENAVTVENVALRTEETSLRLGGSVTNVEAGTPVIDLEASSDKLDIDEIAKLIPALRGYTMQPAFELSARGPADRIAIDLNVREKDLGNATADLTVDVQGPERRVAGTVSVTHLNVGPVARSSTLKSDITGRGQLDLTLPSDRRPLSGTYAIDASRVHIAGYEARDVNAQGRVDGQTLRVDGRAVAYGGRATATGTITTGQPLVVDVTGQAAGLDLRNLPAALDAPGVPSNLQFGYTLKGRGPAFAGEIRFAPSMLADATIASGTTATFRVGEGAPQYTAKGSAAGLDLQKVGRGFGLTALAADRFKSRLNATFDVQGSGGGRYPLTVEASGMVVDAELFGASVSRLDFDAGISKGDAHVRAVGQFGDLNPAIVSGNQKVDGNIDGVLDIDATIRQFAGGVTADSIDASGRINLGSSTVAGLTIDGAVIDGSYASRIGALNQLSITGPDLTVQAQGPVALNETGASNLSLHLEAPSLDRIGRIVDQPLQGAAIVDATLTGNHQTLTLQGTLEGNNLGQGNNSALALTSDFTATVPELDVKAGAVRAKTTATFLEVGGQKVNELTADTAYSQSTLQFNAVAKQGVRELAAGGSVVLHPDHQEIHVGNLGVRSEMIEWRSAPNAEATIQYGGDRIQVENLALVNGDQRITANGTLGMPGESLTVEVRNVDVAQVDRLFLGDQRLGGRITADAVISGSVKAPSATATFTLSPGSFRQFTFESFAGTVDYGEPGINLDVRLQQNPQSWVTAKGFAPTSLFRATPPEMAGTHVAGASGDDINIEVASSQIDLGVVQGFTSYVTNVTGTLQANVKVTGSGYDPHVEGAIQIAGGAFTVPELGTAYTGLDTRIDLEPDEVTISQMRIVDDNGQPLTVGGTLAVHERAVGAVNVNVQSDTFEVIDNEMGRLKLDTNVRLTGELRAPRVEGSIDVRTGTINVSRVLQQTTGGAYSTQAATVEPQQSANPAPTVQTPSVFDTLDLNIALGIPSNLVLNGRDLKTASAPIDLGDMTVTVGGAIELRKAPYDTLRFNGDVNTVRGSYTFQGRRFEITRDGRIRFANGDQIDPILDLEARRVISSVETFVHIRGTMRQPELTFTSNPPLDEADILSLIVFNQSVNELGEGQQASLAERASALAGGYLASGLATSIGRALSLDEFQIQTEGDQGTGAQLSVGEQVGDSLFFRIRQGFGSSQATEFILEYQIREYLRFQGTAADTSTTQRVSFRRVERGGLDLIFFFSY